MTIPTKKLKNGFEMPVFGIGTYNVISQNDNNIYLPEADKQAEIKAIRTAVELGVTNIDTAESYAEGHVEELVGEAIQPFEREKLFLVSKVKYENLNRKGIHAALQKSLERLGTNYLDLYLMHRCPDENKFEEAVTAMNELVDMDIVKSIGLSNTNAAHAKRLSELSKHPFVVNQVHYNLQFREVEKDGLVEFCQNNDMFLEAWRPVNKGSLTKTGTDITKKGIPLLDEMCQKYQKTPAQISINWLISQKNVTTIAKSSRIEHLQENLGALGWQMETADIESLRLAFPDQKFISDTVPLG